MRTNDHAHMELYFIYGLSVLFVFLMLYLPVVISASLYRDISYKLCLSLIEYLSGSMVLKIALMGNDSCQNSICLIFDR